MIQHTTKVTTYRMLKWMSDWPGLDWLTDLAGRLAWLAAMAGRLAWAWLAWLAGMAGLAEWLADLAPR